MLPGSAPFSWRFWLQSPWRRLTTPKSSTRTLSNQSPSFAAGLSYPWRFASAPLDSSTTCKGPWGTVRSRRHSDSMERTLLKAKIHRATVTDANLEYQGSVTLDPLLMRAADVLPFERIEIYNVTNGERFATYAIEGRVGAG